MTSLSMGCLLLLLLPQSLRPGRETLTRVNEVLSRGGPSRRDELVSYTGSLSVMVNIKFQFSIDKNQILSIF